MSAKNTWCQQNKIIIIKNWWNSGFWMRCWSEKYINNTNLITSHFCPWSWICIINIITQKFAHDKIIGRYTKYTLQKMLLLKILYNEYYTMTIIQWQLYNEYYTMNIIQCNAGATYVPTLWSTITDWFVVCMISAHYWYSCEFYSHSQWGVLYTTLWDKDCQWVVSYQWFSLILEVLSINTTEGPVITEILLILALRTHNPHSIYNYR